MRIIQIMLLVAVDGSAIIEAKSKEKQGTPSYKSTRLPDNFKCNIISRLIIIISLHRANKFSNAKAFPVYLT